MATKELPRDFLVCPKEDLLVLISRMLVSLVNINDSYAQAKSSNNQNAGADSDTTLTRFHSRAPPSISIFDYLLRLSHYNSLENSILIIAVYYIDLLSNNYSKFNLNSLTVHRFLLTSTTVAAKGLCDSFCTNNHYAKVGGVNVNELNFLEMEFLQKIGWRVIPRYDDDLDASANANDAEAEAETETEIEGKIENENDRSNAVNRENNAAAETNYKDDNPVEISGDIINNTKILIEIPKNNNDYESAQTKHSYVNSRKKKLSENGFNEYDYDDEHNEISRRTKRHHSQGDISKKITSNNGIRTNDNRLAINDSFFAFADDEMNISSTSQSNRLTISETLSPREPEYYHGEDLKKLEDTNKSMANTGENSETLNSSFDNNDKILSNTTSSITSAAGTAATTSTSGGVYTNSNTSVRLRRLSIAPKYIGIGYSHEILDNYYKKMIDLVGAETHVFLSSSHCSNSRLAYSLVPE